MIRPSSSIFISREGACSVIIHDIDTIPVKDFECFFVDSLTSKEQLQVLRPNKVGIYHKSEFERQLEEVTLGPQQWARRIQIALGSGLLPATAPNTLLRLLRNTRLGNTFLGNTFLGNTRLVNTRLVTTLFRLLSNTLLALVS